MFFQNYLYTALSKWYSAGRLVNPELLLLSGEGTTTIPSTLFSGAFLRSFSGTIIVWVHPVALTDADDSFLGFSLAFGRNLPLGLAAYKVYSLIQHHIMYKPQWIKSLTASKQTRILLYQFSQHCRRRYHQKGPVWNPWAFLNPYTDANLVYTTGITI